MRANVPEDPENKDPRQHDVRKRDLSRLAFAAWSCVRPEKKSCAQRKSSDRRGRFSRDAACDAQSINGYFARPRKICMRLCTRRGERGTLINIM